MKTNPNPFRPLPAPFTYSCLLRQTGVTPMTTMMQVWTRGHRND